MIFDLSLCTSGRNSPWMCSFAVAPGTVDVATIFSIAASVFGEVAN
jgi:hypothetical protein